METRRYYRKDTKYRYYINDETIDKMRDEGKFEEIDNLDNAESELVLNKHEQTSWFIDCLQRVQRSPAYYLENLEFLPEFKVGWNNYGGKYNKDKCLDCGKEYKRKKDFLCKCGSKKHRIVRYGVGYPQ